MKQEMKGWLWHQLDHMQTAEHKLHLAPVQKITMPAPHQTIFTGGMPFLMPNQKCQSTDGN